MKSTTEKDPFDGWTSAELAELAELETLSDDKILERAGKLGPAIVGRPLFHLASRIRETNADGNLGPAITNPDHDAKSLAKRGLKREESGAIVPLDTHVDHGEGAEDITDVDAGASIRTHGAVALDNHDYVGAEAVTGDIDPTDINDPRNPWTYVTLSGAKQLAMKNEVSHKARVTRADLIAELQKANVVPPPVPSPEELADDDDDEREVDG